MKAKRQKKTTDAHVEKIAAFAGLVLVATGCLANLYGAYANRSFINDPIDLPYYLRYIVLLGGGFAAGYFLTQKPAQHTRHNQLFLGVVYAALAIALYWLFDLARASLLSSLSSPVYPWGKAVLFGLPLLATITAAAVAYFSQRRPSRSHVSTFTKLAIVLSLATTELHTLIQGTYDLSTGVASYGPDMSIWLIFVSYLITPLTIAIVSYLLLNTIKKRLDRFFFAGLIGTFYSALTLVLWEFRTDASYNATNIFNHAVTVIGVLFVGVLLWRIRKATR